MASSKTWEMELQDMFKEYDKDNSGELTRQDLVLMLLESTKKQKRDPLFKMNVDFLIACLRDADLDDDSRISFDEFKRHIEKAIAQSPGNAK